MVCIDLVSRFYQAVRRGRLFRDGCSPRDRALEKKNKEKARIMKTRDCRQFRNRIPVCREQRAGTTNSRFVPLMIKP